MEKTKPGINQVSTLRDLIESDIDLKQKFDFKNEETMEKAWEILEDITLKQYKFFLALLYNREGYKLIPILKKKGLQTKD